MSTAKYTIMIIIFSLNRILYLLLYKNRNKFYRRIMLKFDKPLDVIVINIAATAFELTKDIIIRLKVW